MGFSHLKSKLLLYHSYHTSSHKINNHSLSPSSLLRNSWLQVRGFTNSLRSSSNIINDRLNKLMIIPNINLQARHISSTPFLNANQASRHHVVLARPFERTWRSIWNLLKRNNYSLPKISIFAGVTYLLFSYEKVPILEKNHFVISSDKIETSLGRFIWQQMYDKYSTTDSKCKILPPTSPEAARALRITGEIIGAMHKGLGLRSEAKISGVSPKEMRNSKRKKEPKTKWFTWYGTKHLEGLEWQVMVIDDSRTIEAAHVPYGRLVVYSGVLKDCESDAEVATIIGHEIAHGVARHFSGIILRYIRRLIAIAVMAVYHTLHLNLVTKKEAHEFLDDENELELSISRRKELEADYIGLMLMAMAGYDPRVAPSVYMKLNRDKIDNFLSTHPCGATRARKLKDRKVMDRAVAIYVSTSKKPVYQSRA